MKRFTAFLAILPIAGTVLAGYLFYQPSALLSQVQAQTSEEQALKAFAAIQPLDVHLHVFKTDQKFPVLFERLNLKLMNILVVEDALSYRKQLEPQITEAIALARSSRGHIALCTTFDRYNFRWWRKVSGKTPFTESLVCNSRVG